MINNDLKEKAMLEVCKDLNGNIDSLTLLAHEHVKKYAQYMDSLKWGNNEEKELLITELGIVKELIVKSVIEQYTASTY